MPILAYSCQKIVVCMYSTILKVKKETLCNNYVCGMDEKHYLGAKLAREYVAPLKCIPLCQNVLLGDINWEFL